MPTLYVLEEEQESVAENVRRFFSAAVIWRLLRTLHEERITTRALHGL
jgi:hypothetical protein